MRMRAEGGPFDGLRVNRSADDLTYLQQLSMAFFATGQ